MKEHENSALTPPSSSGGQALTDYALVLVLVLVVCLVVVGEIGVQVSSLLALVLPAFAA